MNKKNKIKKITLLILMVLTVTSVLYEAGTTVFAEKRFKKENFSLNNVYNKDEVVNLYDISELKFTENTDGSGSYYYNDVSYPDEMVSTKVIVYQDKEGNNLYTYIPLLSAGYYYEKYYMLPDVTIGATIEEEYTDEFIKDLYDVLKDNLYRSESSYTSVITSQRANIQKLYVLYNDSTRNIKDISKWQVVESQNPTLYELCKNDSKVNQATECNNIISKVNSSNSGSGSYYLTDSYRNYINSEVITLKEYEEPTFNFDCSPSTIEYQEKTICNLKLNTTDKIVEIKTNLNSNDLKLEDIKSNEKWNLKQDDSGYYILTNEEGLSGEDTPLTITLLAEKNEDKNVDVILENLTYKTSTGYTNTINLNSKIKTQSIQKSPETSDIKIILFAIILILSGTFIIIDLKKKVL